MPLDVGAAPTAGCYRPPPPAPSLQPHYRNPGTNAGALARGRPTRPDGTAAAGPALWETPVDTAAFFPSPLTLFERYMLLDDRRDYPMTFAIQAQFRGNARRELFEQALEDVVRAHPLLRATVCQGFGRRPVWNLAASTRPWLDWADHDLPIDPRSAARIDLRRQPGFRVWVRLGPQTTTATFQVHHACCDGLGLLQVIGDVLARYASGCGENAASRLEELDPALLARRGVYRVEIPPNISRWKILKETLREAGKWLLRRPVPLALPKLLPRVAPASENLETAPLPYPGILAHTFDEAETRRLRLAAQRRGVSINDLLLRDLFLACHEWNVRHGRMLPHHWLRINMPQNLRQRHHEGMPAANVMSQAFLTRRVHDCTHPERLLSGLCAETAAIKRWRLGLYFLGGLALADRLPGILPLGVALFGRSCHSTTVLTNIGDAARRLCVRLPRENGRVVAGNLILQSLLGMPPLRPGTRAGFGVGIYAGELTVTVRGDVRTFGSRELQELLELYVDRIRQSAS